MSIFQHGNFRLHSGAFSDWKLVLDTLGAQDWDTLASLGAKLVGRFDTLEGIPEGGTRFAMAMKQYKTPEWPESDIHIHLIVDDVLTTGSSFEAYKRKAMLQQPYSAIKGLVAFARGRCPEWVKPIFMLHPELHGK